MANKTRRDGQVSLAVLGAQLVDEIASQYAPPPEGAFTLYDVMHKFVGLKRVQVERVLKQDSRFDSKIFRGKRYYWPKA